MDKTHSSFLRCPVTLLLVAVVAGRTDVFPCAQATLTLRNNVLKF